MALTCIKYVFKPFKTLWILFALHRGAEVKWSAPRKAPIAIFDAVALESLTPLFGDEDFEVIYLRGEKVYITPSILWRMVVNLVKVHHPFVAYLLALVQHIRPSIVVTYIDNNGYFGRVAQQYKDARFLAIQNGMRCLSRDNADSMHPLYLPEFACFGQYEINIFTQHGAKVDKFYPIGSLRDAYYQEYYADKMPTAKYDLCLVSEAEAGLPHLYPEIEVAIKKLATYLARFCEKTKKTICIATRNHPDQDKQSYRYELQWYREQMGEHVNLIPNIRSKFSTYRLIDSSTVSLSFYSTALVEAFGRGRKSLFCNFSNNEIYDLPEKGLWTLGSCTYEEFEERLISLLEMSDAEFQKKSSNARLYLMNYDPVTPTHMFLKNLISEAVSK